MIECASFLQHFWPDWLSMFSVFLLIAGLARPVLTPALSAWLLFSCLLSFSCVMQLPPIDLTATGYSGNTWRALLVPALWVCITVNLAAAGGLWPALAALLPAVLWRAGVSPAPGLFENYLDVPLMLVVLYRLIRTVRREGALFIRG
jgi:hypothetical protein